MTPNTNKPRLILAGGGHTHALVLKMHLMNPLDYEIILVSEHPFSFYSGMLPGYLAGHYSLPEISIDLRKLSSSVGVQFIHDSITGIDKEQKQLLLANHPPLHYDILSVNTGSIPNLEGIKTNAKSAIGIKPLKDFIPYWEKMLSMDPAMLRMQEMVVIGGGAAGIETALAIKHRFDCKIHLINSDKNLFKDGSQKSSAKLLQYINARGITIHFGKVQSIQKNPKETVIYTNQNLVIPHFHSLPIVLLLTGSMAPIWTQNVNLPKDDKGFFVTDSRLLSLSDSSIYIVGDTGIIQGDPRPRAGVYAVRQAKFLFHNLKNHSLGKWKQYKPQKHFLILMGTGNEQAFASKGNWFYGPSRWIWKWKHIIDTGFMTKIQNTAMADSGEEMKCLGCGAKVGETILRPVLHKIQKTKSTNKFNDDAAIFSPPKGHLLLQTVDFFPLLNLDTYTAARICANHCLNDIFAMGGKPEQAMAILSLPPSKFQQETLYHLLAGIEKTLGESKCLLAGGHTAEGKQLSAGLTITGSVKKNELLPKEINRTGLDLILTKAIGTGTIFAADMRGKASGRWITQAITSMLQSNQKAISILKKHKALSCTDISGFGLAGHLLEMLALGFTAELELDRVPVLEGAYECMRMGIFSSLQNANESVLPFLTWNGPLSRIQILFDPQTAGGLLAAIPSNQTKHCVSQLIQSGFAASHIGKISTKTNSKKIMVL